MRLEDGSGTCWKVESDGEDLSDLRCNVPLQLGNGSHGHMLDMVQIVIQTNTI